jgi:DNA-binding transcriptional ArsR family regulator
MAYDNLAQTFAAFGEPTRQRIVGRLAQAPASVGELAAELPISRPAVSQHLKVPISRPAVSQHLKALRDAGLVEDEAVGTRRIYRLDPRGIGAMRDALDAHWRSAMSDFKRFADRLADEEDERKDQE